MSRIDSSAKTAAAQITTGAGLTRTLYLWHWISAAICVPAMLMFAITGITLNHAADIQSNHAVRQQQAQLPPELARALQAQNTERAPLPEPIRQWLSAELDIASSALKGRDAEWSEDEVYLGLPRPGGDAWLRIERESGAVEFEDSDRGWIAYFNDLHKGRNTGTAWRWFIDIFGAACIVFTLTGLLILAKHSARRPLTWPITGLGLLAPLLLMLLLIH